MLQAALKTNLVVLATAHAVSEGIIRRLSGDLVPQGVPASLRRLGTRRRLPIQARRNRSRSAGRCETDLS